MFQIKRSNKLSLLMSTLTVGLLAFMLPSIALAQQSPNCSELQGQFDRIRSGFYEGSSWTDVKKIFGEPFHFAEDKPYKGWASLHYAFPGCSVRFDINTSGNVAVKAFQLGAAALVSHPETSAAEDLSDVKRALASLQATMRQLQAQMARLERAVDSAKVSARSAHSSNKAKARVPVPYKSAPSLTAPSAKRENVSAINTAATLPLASPIAGKPSCAENGSCYGDLSAITGLPKTIYVHGYYRKDGTYVRGHYRSSRRR